MFRSKVVSFAFAMFASLCLAGCGGSSKPLSIAVTVTSSTVDGANSVTISAAVTNDKNNAGVTWTVSGGGTLSNSTTTSVTFTAPAATSAAQTITITATSVADSTKVGTLTLTIPAKPTVASTGANLAGTVGGAYSVQLTGNGGISPYTWAVTSGSLPPCLTMTTGGLITGTVTASCAGTYNVTFTMSDSGTPNKLTATASLTITIAAAPAITFTGTVPATATYKVAYTGSAAATGGAGTLTYTVSAGALPAGVSLNASTGAITGAPTAAGAASFTIKAADAFGDSATQSYTIVTSYPAMSITTPVTLPVGYVGSAYTSTTLAATGGTGVGANYTWAVAGGSSLPAGLSLSPAGVLSGTPTGSPATGTFTVNVTDTVATLTGSATFTLQVKAGVSITTATTLPVGYAGSNYSQTLAATGGSGTGYVWTVSSGSTLPAGLTLSSAGVLSGKPTATGTPTFGITATDSVGNKTSATFSLTVDAGITITPPTLPKGYEGAAYPGAAFTAVGGTSTGYSWSWAAASGSSLPAGLGIGAATGAISGTPTASGTFNVVVTVTDSVSNTASVNASITVEATLAVTTASPLHGGTINVAYSQTLAASGGSGTYTNWQVTVGGATLTPLNLSLSPAGVLSGTPTTTGSASFTVQVTDSETHTATANFTVTVSNALTVTTTTLPAGTTGTAYSQTLGAAGGTGTGYTWSATASNLATYGLSLSSAGVVSGTPTQTGTASFTANVTDSGSNTAQQALTITVYAPLALPTPGASVPGPATVGEAYDGQIMASGGSGNYSWTVTGLPADGLSAALSGAVQHVTGTPTSATTVTFTMKVTDTTTSQSVGPNTYSIVVSNPAPLTLPTPNPSSLPSATVGTAYSGTISASGGASPYSWTVNTVAIPTNGTAVTLSNGLSVSNTGGNTLSVGGTPTSTGTVSIAAAIKDNLNTTVSNTYTVQINSAGSVVSGQVYLQSPCSGGVAPPTITLTINTSPSQQAQTDSNGNFSFASVPNGTWTITPSISGASSVFVPATQSVTVNNASLTHENFNVSLGYTVSGTVSYSGSSTGRVYLVLNNNNCGGTGNQTGTSIASAGSFTINGVPPGTYTLAASMDTLGFGAPNVNDPSGSTSNITVATANVTGANVTMTNPSAVTLTAGPTIQIVSPANQGAAIPFKPITNSNGVEMATSYTLQWSTSSTFSPVTGSKTFPANGDSSDVWILTGLTNGQTLYFRAEGNVGSTSSPWSAYGGGTPTAVTIGAPTSGSAITGTVTFTGTATGPLLVGFYSQTSGVYTAVVSNPVSPQAFSVNVPNGSGYFFFGIIDQNNNGIVDAGDITNTGNGNDSSNSVTISGSATMNLTLPSANSTAKVTTQYWKQTNSGGTNTGYNVNFDIRQGNKLPVAVQLTSGPNVINPIDIAACSDCGTPQFQYYVALNGATPTVGDAYVFKITYSDGSSENLTANVTGWNSTSTLVGASDLATNLAPAVSGTTTPTFSWTDPSGASSYTYQFWIQPNNGGTIWQIPGQNSQLNGFSSSITSIAWPTDPTDSSNTPSVGSLTHGTSYNWTLQVTDSSGNQAQAQTYFVP